LWRLAEGLASPESVIYDPQRRQLYVSSTNGRGDAVDGNGYVSVVGADGRMLVRDWAVGMDGPKGLALADGLLYGTDILRMFAIDPASGAMVWRRQEPGVVYLNDAVAAPDGGVFVSDARGNAIVHVDASGVRDRYRNPAMQRPNGVSVWNGALYALIGTPGAGDDPGDHRVLARLEPGRDPIVQPSAWTDFGRADGLEPDGRGGWFITTNATNQVLHSSPRGAVTVLATLEANTTDLCFDAVNQRLYVPSGRGNFVQAYSVNW
jgi:sugar lactone lactonase YvrE